jgi:hypothetical protein
MEHHVRVNFQIYTVLYVKLVAPGRLLLYRTVSCLIKKINTIVFFQKMYDSALCSSKFIGAHTCTAIGMFKKNITGVLIKHVCLGAVVHRVHQNRFL